jgi:TRAP transporter TAXI family solute receptor
MTDTFTSRSAKILATLAESEAAGFFEAYPFYSAFTVPAGSYPGVDAPVETWRDAGIWIVSADMDEDLVYNMTKAIYDSAGLEHMLRVTNVAREMGIENALSGIALPLHPGAARYWAEVGVAITAVAQPRD